jgi:HK97 family phage major capsid protein
MDNEIIRGDTSKGELEGITTKVGVKSIALTDADMADWKALQKKIFAVLPLAMRSKPYEFLMSAGTYESNIKTLSDSANRPVYSETFSPVDGALSCKFKGHDVTLVEQDILPDFDSASANDVFGVLWVPAEAYAVNTNAEFTVVRYFDHETNQEVTKALVVNDGKVLRTDLIYLLTKTAK